MTPVPPLNAPGVISLAFWGGVWGALWALIRASRGGAYWTKALVIRCTRSESRRVVRSNADKGHGPRWRLAPENHRQCTAAERRLGTRRGAADAATEPSQCSIKK
jgi:hypothetical protein